MDAERRTRSAADRKEDENLNAKPSVLAGGEREGLAAIRHACRERDRKRKEGESGKGQEEAKWSERGGVWWPATQS